MPTTSPFYRAAAALLVPFVPLVLRDPRQRAAHAARLASPDAIATWAGQHRDRRRPLAWFHASSVGEGLQALAVLDAFRSRCKDVQVIYTHYSPSAVSLAARMPADWSGYLPYDRAVNVEAVLDALAPDLLVFTKLDLWPELATRAAAGGTAVALVAATVRPASGRLREPVRSLLAPGYRALDAIGAVSRADAARLVALGCFAERIIVTGDPRFDSVLDAADAATPDATGDPAITLVAGSTWPADDALLLDAFARVRATHPDARLIIVPHDPTLAHLDGIDALAARHRLPSPVRFSALSDGPQPAIISVDRVGVLARLYSAGAIAYVGGGWETKGIHSVLEPAAWRHPVIIGPKDQDNRDVQLLLRAGALVQLPAVQGPSALATQWRMWLSDERQRRNAGNAARTVLEGERGAAAQSAALLADLLPK